VHGGFSFIVWRLGVRALVAAAAGLEAAAASRRPSWSARGLALGFGNLLWLRGGSVLIERASQRVVFGFCEFGDEFDDCFVAADT
jgi:hypothetical protein